MSKITTTVCDRCGKPFEYRLSKWAGYFVQGIKKENHLHFHSLNYGNPDGYAYSDVRYDLCAECTEKLLRFLRCEKPGGEPSDEK